LKLKREVQKLEGKIKKEKQFNRQLKLMGELRKLKSELDENLKINGGIKNG